LWSKDGKKIIIIKEFDKKEVEHMPRGDGTGPLGMGPRTGRGMGFCAGFPVPGYRSAGFGRGFGRGRGFKRMFCHWWPYYAPYGYHPAVPQAPQAVDQKEMLQREAQLLEDQLNQIRERLNQLESDK
jgi:hypothetical protein